MVNQAQVGGVSVNIGGPRRALRALSGSINNLIQLLERGDIVACFVYTSYAKVLKITP